MMILKKEIIFMLTVLSPIVAKTEQFFWDKKANAPRAGYHYNPTELVFANMNPQSVPLNSILTSSDPSKTGPEENEARMAFIWQNPANGQWYVNYYSIKDLPTRVFNNQIDAQKFAVAHLQSGSLYTNQTPAYQASTIQVAPKKAVVPSKESKNWRRAHLRR